jgi:hypothetical protein
MEGKGRIRGLKENNMTQDWEERMSATLGEEQTGGELGAGQIGGSRADRQGLVSCVVHAGGTELCTATIARGAVRSTEAVTG